ncbi:MAG: glycosyltransferase family 2 protein [Alicyclobacillus sp.]|nr:glycosyltransferase family 2 protein [Alicyclobacillus sp.]
MEIAIAFVLSVIAVAWCVILLYNLPGLLCIPRIPVLGSGTETGSNGLEVGASTGIGAIEGDQGDVERVSVIVAARNEEKSIARTLDSLVHQSYPLVEIIVVDDRSDDGTPDEIGRVIRRYPQAQIKMVTIRTLPHGWIGKNHALYVGALAASGDWLLFADADVYFHPDAIRRAIWFVHRHRLQHLTVAPRLLSRGYLLRLLTGFFVLMLLLFARPHYAIRKHSGAFAGIGAFNLIRRSVYHAVGTHQAMPLRPDDDVHLGKLVKRAGYRQCFAVAEDFIEIVWYSSLREMIRGMEKTPLAALRYSAMLLVVYMAALVLLYGGLYAGAIWGVAHIASVSLGRIHGTSSVSGVSSVLSVSATGNEPTVATGFAGLSVSAILCAGALVLLLVVDGMLLNYLRFPVHQIILLPVGLSLYVYAFVRAVVLLKQRGGLMWRDSYYGVDELRRGLAGPPRNSASRQA